MHNLLGMKIKPKHPREFEGTVAYMHFYFHGHGFKRNITHVGEVVEFKNEKVTHWHEYRKFVEPRYTMIHLN